MHAFQWFQCCQAVADATGREDLRGALRRRLLLSVAARRRCGRLALGDSASLLAVRAVSLAAKGAGYALPGEIQHLDARWASGCHAYASVGHVAAGLFNHRALRVAAWGRQEFFKVEILAGSHPATPLMSGSRLAASFLAVLQQRQYPMVYQRS